ncbi:hypothetical protein LZ30DRAFT_396457 [Colletotrichum cereale]|nr:hypothetical protein LZ30DRAFT_396457 [Colletotrichum cereale]
MDAGAQADIRIIKCDTQPKVKETMKGGVGNEWRDSCSQREGIRIFFVAAGKRFSSVPAPIMMMGIPQLMPLQCPPNSGHRGPNARLRSLICARRMQGPRPPSLPPYLPTDPVSACKAAMISGRGSLVLFVPTVAPSAHSESGRRPSGFLRAASALSNIMYSSNGCLVEVAVVCSRLYDTDGDVWSVGGCEATLSML